MHVFQQRQVISGNITNTVDINLFWHYQIMVPSFWEPIKKDYGGTVRVYNLTRIIYGSLEAIIPRDTLRAMGALTVAVRTVSTPRM